MRYRILAVVAALMLLAAACGDSASDDTSSPATTAAPATTATPATTAAPATTEASGGDVAGPSVALGTSGLGEFLTDGEGNTLYLFLPDGQGESTCYDQCEANWPVFSGEGAGAGVDAALLGTFTRTDGNPQTTYNGWPLYYFAADAAPGDTNGQGVGDVWFVVTPTGDPIQ